MFRKVLAVGALAIVLASVPAQLAAAEKEVPGPGQATILRWLTGIWGELATWVTTGAETDSGCWIDPAGGCSHGAPPPESATSDGSGYVDPNG